jgi:2'-5' RNA ligase
MRMFIAVDFDNYTKNKILNLQNALRNQALKGRWKTCDNFHLTLKFLGEVDERRLQILDQTLKNVSKDSKKFFIRLNKLGYFGKNSTEPIRVVWLGVDET